MENLTQLFSGVLAPEHLWVVFYGIVSLFLVMAAILLYHWQRYKFEGDKWIQPMRMAFLILGIVVLWLFYISTATLTSL